MRLSTFLYCFWPFGLPFPQVTSSYSLFIFFSPVLFCLFCFDFGSPKNTLDIHPLCFEDVLSEYVAYLFVLFIISLIIRNHKILIYSNISVLLLYYYYYYYFLLFKKSFPGGRCSRAPAGVPTVLVSWGPMAFAVNGQLTRARGRVWRMWYLGHDTQVLLLGQDPAPGSIHQPSGSPVCLRPGTHWHLAPLLHDSPKPWEAGIWLWESSPGSG